MKKGKTLTYTYLGSGEWKSREKALRGEVVKGLGLREAYGLELRVVVLGIMDLVGLGDVMLWLGLGQGVIDSKLGSMVVRVLMTGVGLDWRMC